MTPPAAPLRNHDIADLRRLGVAHHLAPQQDWQAVEDPGGSRIIVRGEERSLGWIGPVKIVSEPGTNRRFGSGGIACIVLRDMCIANGQMVRGVKDPS